MSNNLFIIAALQFEELLSNRDEVGPLDDLLILLSLVFPFDSLYDLLDHLIPYLQHNKRKPLGLSEDLVPALEHQ